MKEDDNMKALKALWNDAELPGEAAFGDTIINVPEGMKSLLKSIKIKVTNVMSQNSYYDVSWSYEHPDSGTNGKTIGYVIKDLETGKWGWRNETKRDENGRCNFGYVEQFY